MILTRMMMKMMMKMILMMMVMMMMMMMLMLEYPEAMHSTYPEARPFPCTVR